VNANGDSPPPARRAGRFPGFDVLALSKHWDQVTAGVVLARIGTAPDIRFFTPVEATTATALFDQLLDQNEHTRLPIVQHVDSRLAEQQTDGWRFDDMPDDGRAWRGSLAALDAEAATRHGQGFAACSSQQQRELIQAVQDAGSTCWHGLNALHLWNLWTRYACTAFYAHPSAWDEIGFPGPAYPRGYKNPGVNTREPFEVPDAHPSADPTHPASQ
jgi:Gluconate 2-dehydrogenase subunit 3